MPKLFTIQEYLAKHGENDTLKEIDNYEEEEFETDVSPETQNKLKELGKHLFAKGKRWAGIYLNQHDFTLIINEETYYIPTVTPDRIKEELIYRFLEEEIFALFDIKAYFIKRMVNWWVILPSTDNGWLRIGYTYRNNENKLMETSTY